MRKTTKTNFTALILAAILLAVVLFYWGDVKAYQMALNERDSFADMVAADIKMGNPIDSQQIAEEEARINESIQLLKYNTDLGEILAENEQSSENRGCNSMILGAYGVLLIGLPIVILINVLRMLWNMSWMIYELIERVFYKGRHTANKSKKSSYEDAVPNHDFEDDEYAQVDDQDEDDQDGE